MYWIYIDGITLFNPMFMKNVQVHNYNTRQKDHYHLHCFKTRPRWVYVDLKGINLINQRFECNVLTVETPAYVHNVYDIVLEKYMYIVSMLS